MQNKEPFFLGQATYDELGFAINLGLAYESLSGIIGSDIQGPARFILDTDIAKDLIHLNWGVQTSGPGLLTVFGESPTVNITDIGDEVTYNNYRADINKVSDVKFYENSIVSDVGTNIILGPLQIGTLGSQGSGGDSIGGILSPSQKIILPPGSNFIFSFVPEFDLTNITFFTIQFVKGPNFQVGIN